MGRTGLLVYHTQSEVSKHSFQWNQAEVYHNIDINEYTPWIDNGTSYINPPNVLYYKRREIGPNSVIPFQNENIY